MVGAGSLQRSDEPQATEISDAEQGVLGVRDASEIIFLSWYKGGEVMMRAMQRLAELAVNIWHDVSDERRREEHERYLSDVTAALSKSLDYQATLDTLANLLVPGLCDWCASIPASSGTSLIGSA